MELQVSLDGGPKNHSIWSLDGKHMALGYPFMGWNVGGFPKNSSRDGIHIRTDKKYPLVNIQKAIENGPFIVNLPIKNGDFP